MAAAAAAAAAACVPVCHKLLFSSFFRCESVLFLNVSVFVPPVATENPQNSPTFDIDVNFDIGVSSLAAFLSRKEPKNSSNFRFSVLCEFEFSVWSNP